MQRSRKLKTLFSALLVTLHVAGCAPQTATPPAPTTTRPTTPAAPDSAIAAEPTTNTTPADAGATATSIADAASATEPAAKSETAKVPAEPAAAFYSVGSYDENRDPTVDLADTIRRATAENKRILIQVGGEWCGWCHRISKYMETNEKVRPLIDEHFVVMKVTYPGTHAESFLAQYPQVEAYPHLFVLEPEGKFLHSQGTAELEFEKGYNEEVFSKFLSDWKL